MDENTLSKLARKKDLLVLENRSQEEVKELQILDKELDDYSSTFRDPDYTRFLKAWKQAGYEFANSLTESKESQEIKERKALEIAKKLLGLT